MTNLHPSPELPRRLEFVVTLWLHRPEGAVRIEQPVLASHPEFAAALAGTMWAQLYNGACLTVEIERVETMHMNLMRRAPKPGIIAAIRRRLAAILNPD